MAFDDRSSGTGKGIIWDSRFLATQALFSCRKGTRMLLRCTSIPTRHVQHFGKPLPGVDNLQRDSKEVLLAACVVSGMCGFLPAMLTWLLCLRMFVSRAIPLTQHVIRSAFFSQANKWIKAMEGTNLTVVDLNTKDFLRQMGNCIQYGLPCLLQARRFVW